MDLGLVAQPASLPETVSVLPDAEALSVFCTKCGLPAQALGIATPNTNNADIAAISIRRIVSPII